MLVTGRWSTYRNVKKIFGYAVTKELCVQLLHQEEIVNPSGD
jgi:hypothetical protein